MLPILAISNPGACKQPGTHEQAREMSKKSFSRIHCCGSRHRVGDVEVPKSMD